VDKKLILMIGVAVLAVASLIYGIVTPSKVRREIQAASKSGSPAPPPLQIPMPLERQAQRTSFADWDRNPFSLGETESEKPTLKGIAWDELSPQAILNDQIVQVGDRIGKYKVVTIHSRGVVLNDGTKDFELRPEA